MQKIVELFHDIDCTLSPMISFYSALSDQKFLKVLHYFFMRKLVMEMSTTLVHFQET